MFPEEVLILFQSLATFLATLPITFATFLAFFVFLAVPDTVASFLAALHPPAYTTTKCSSVRIERRSQNDTHFFAMASNHSLLTQPQNVRQYG
jgi:hypothetical protein